MARTSCLVIAAMIVGGLLAGCGGKDCPAPAQPTPPPPDPTMARVTAFEEEVCACEDLACVAKAEREMGAWAESQEEAFRALFRNPLRRGQLEAGIDRSEACKKPLMEAATPAERAAAYPDGSGDAAEAIAKMGKLADDLCACRDMKCAEGVMREMAAMKEPAGKPTKAQMEEAMTLAERMAGCQKRLMEAEGY